MPMIHHDAREYNVAVSEAAKEWKRRLDEQIRNSVPRVNGVIEQVQNDVPQDAIVLGNKLHFESTKEGGVLVALPKQKEALTIHNNAYGQLAWKSGVRGMGSLVTDLRQQGEWGAKLIAHNFNQIFQHNETDRFLVRQVRGEMRGFLTDNYRRLDSRPLLEAFINTVKDYNARPIDGFALDTKIKVRVILPMIMEPFPGELMAFGAELSDSDYGDGALSVRGIVERMYCTNLATTKDVLRAIHLGKRLSDDMIWSNETYELDTKSMASQVRDVAAKVLAPPAINEYLDMVRKANEEKITGNEILAWVKKNMTAADGKAAVEKFNSPDIELLPPGNTKWRWSNAISWLANEQEDDRKKLELQDLAGQWVDKDSKLDKVER